MLLLLARVQAVESQPIDYRKAERAEVVLRVKLISPGEGSKYLWPEVEVLKVLKNRSGLSFRKRLRIAHYSWEPGVPDGMCTIYLERYGRRRGGLWKLLNGSGRDGISHVSK